MIYPITAKYWETYAENLPQNDDEQIISWNGKSSQNHELTQVTESRPRRRHVKFCHCDDGPNGVQTQVMESAHYSDDNHPQDQMTSSWTQVNENEEYYEHNANQEMPGQSWNFQDQSMTTSLTSNVPDEDLDEENFGEENDENLLEGVNFDQDNVWDSVQSTPSTTMPEE